MELTLEMINNKTILLIEDDIEIGKWLIKQISGISNIESVHWGTRLSESFLLFEQIEPDIIILDLKLPDGSGIEMLKKVKTINSTVKVYVFSINSELKNTCLRKGADGFFDKSVDSHKLISTISEV